MADQDSRLLTTHTGSLPRPVSLLKLLFAETLDGTQRAAFDDECRAAVNDAVKMQCEVGLDIVNDGEMAKTGFVSYVRDRIGGIGGEQVPRWPNLEDREFADDPKWKTPQVMLQACTSKLVWEDFSKVERDIEVLREALAGRPHKGAFMSSLSPGLFANHHPNRLYPTRDAYLADIVSVLKREYEAIAAAGFIVQLDSPDLAQRSNNFPDMPLSEWRKIIAAHVEAMNAATASIPVEQIRVHVCWGNYNGPHNHDTELKDIVDILVKLRCGGLSVVGANGRHAHEWRVWQDIKLPDGMKLIPGVLDSVTSVVEHPEVVAERLVNYASVLGRDNLIAGTDCGFGTLADNAPIPPKVAWAKLRSLVQGTQIASKRLWERRVRKALIA